jgi:glycosyltransferase involved in cell wall biosynthesis
MKVGMTTGSLSRDAGGLFESVRALGKGLAASGVEVGVFGLWDANWERDKGEWEPLSVRACGFRGPRAVAWSGEMDLALEEFAPDVVHLNGLWQYSSVATRGFWRRRGARYVVSPRGMLDVWALANARWKKRLAGLLFENAVLRDAGCLHALCEAEAGAMRAYGLGQRIEVVPNGVGLPEGLTTEDTERAEGKKRLLFLGRIHPKKGLVGMLRAWAEMKRDTARWGDWEFVVAGWDQGGHEGELRELCGELGLRVGNRMGSHGGTANTADVVFLGAAFGEEKEALLRSAEAFVLPSLSEGLPMSVLEAWAYGLPVVMTPECNLPEGFASQAALEIQNAGMGDSKWEGLRGLLEMDDGERRGMGMRGRRLVEERFTWPKVAGRMREVFESLV